MNSETRLALVQVLDMDNPATVRVMRQLECIGAMRAFHLLHGMMLRASEE
jgi:hypothetical protein